MAAADLVRSDDVSKERRPLNGWLWAAFGRVRGGVPADVGGASQVVAELPFTVSAVFLPFFSVNSLDLEDDSAVMMMTALLLKYFAKVLFVLYARRKAKFRGASSCNPMAAVKISQQLFSLLPLLVVITRSSCCLGRLLWCFRREMMTVWQCQLFTFVVLCFRRNPACKSLEFLVA